MTKECKRWLDLGGKILKLRDKEAKDINGSAQDKADLKKYGILANKSKKLEHTILRKAYPNGMYDIDKQKRIKF